MSDVVEALSLKFWKTGLVPAEQRLPDGFMDKWRAPVEETMEVPECLLCDTRRDPRLLELCNHALSAIKRGRTLRDKIEELARLVAERLGGTMMLDTVAECTESLTATRAKNIKRGHVLLGDLTCGLSRHRGLMFKFLADRCNLSVSLNRGTHLVALEDLHNYNTVEIDGSDYLPNLMRDVAALYPVHSDMATAYLRVQKSEGRLLYFPNCYLPRHQRPASAQAREFVPLADVNLDQLPVPDDGVGSEVVSKRRADDPRGGLANKTEAGHDPLVCGVHQHRPTVHPKLEPLKYIQQKTAASVVRVGVDQAYQSISEAVNACGQSARVLVEPGHYIEHVELDKAVYLQGMGESPGDVIIECAGPTCLLITAKYGRCIVQNLSVRHTGTDFGFEVRQGSHEMRECHVMSSGRSCVAFHGNSCELNMIGSKITGDAQVGVFAFNAAKGLIEDNDIEGIAGQGIGVASQASPMVSRNRVSNCGGTGILCEDTGAGSFIEGNTITANADCGIRITGKGSLTVRRNNLVKNSQAGILVEDTQNALVEANDLSQHSDFAIEISCTVGLSCRQNTVHDGDGVGVLFRGEGNVTSFEHNNITQNIGVGAIITQGANPFFCHNNISECEAEGLVIGDAGLGRVEDNMFCDNKGSGIVVQEGGCPIIRHNTIMRQRRCGIALLDGASVNALDDNEIVGCFGSGVWLGATVGKLLVRRHRISNGDSTGLEACNTDNVTVFQNDISGNKEAGVLLRGSSIEVNSNRIREGRGDGLCCMETDNSTILANNIFGNQGSGMRISGFETCPKVIQNHIRMNKVHGMVVTEGAEGHIANNEIYGNVQYGISMILSSSVMITQNKITKHQAGVVFERRSQGTMLDNDVQENVQYGVWILTESLPSLRKNRIHHCDQVGIGLAEDAKGLIEDNELCICGVGIEITGRSVPFVKKNRIYDVGEGITVSDGAGAKIDENRINSIGTCGISVSTGGHPKCWGNQIYNSRGTGITVRDNGEGVFDGNKVYNVVGHSMEVVNAGKDDPARLVFKDNIIYDGEAGGICVRNFGFCEVVGNTISNHLGAGLKVMDHSEPTMERNSVNGCHIGLHSIDGSAPTCRENSFEKCVGQASIVIEGDNAAGRFEHNTVANSLVPGVTVTRNARPIVRLNTITKTAGHGILIEDFAKGQMIGNQVIDVNGTGMRVTTGANPLMKLNNMVNISGHGIQVIEEGSGTAEENEIVSCGKWCIHVASAAQEILFLKNRVHNSPNGGIFIEDATGGAEFRENDVYSIERTSVEIAKSKAIFADNRVRAGVGDGIHCRDGDLSTVQSNNIDSVTGNGIRLSGLGTDTIVELNLVQKNKSNGIHIEAGSNGQLIENELKGNSEVGLSLTAAGTPLIKGNTVTGHMFGARVDRGSGGVFEGNLITKCETHGVLVANKSTPSFIRNEISFCEHTGIRIESGSKVPEVRENRMHDHGRECIMVGMLSSANISGNELWDAKHAGVLLADGSQGLVRDNNVYQIKDAAIAVTTAEPFEVTGNLVTHTTGRGLHIASSAMNGNIHDNEVVNKQAMTRGMSTLGSSATSLDATVRLSDAENDFVQTPVGQRSSRPNSRLNPLKEPPSLQTLVGY